MTETEPKKHDLLGQQLCLEEIIEVLPEGETNVKISRGDFADFLKAIAVNIAAHEISDTGACVRGLCGFTYHHASGKIVNFLGEDALEKGNLRAETRNVKTLFHANNFKGVNGRTDIVAPYEAEELVSTRK